MKRSFHALAVAAALTVLPAASMAADIVVVNVQEIMAKSSAAKSIRSQLESTTKSYQSEISKQEEKLKTQGQELSKQRSSLSADGFEQKSKAFRESVAKVQQDARTKKTQLDIASSNAASEVQKAVQGIIEDMAKEKNFTLAVPASQVLYAKADMDITAEVLKRLDEKLPKVTVKIPSPSSKSEKSE